MDKHFTKELFDATYTRPQQPPVVPWQKNLDLMMLVEDFGVFSPLVPGGRMLIPAGTRTNGASIPRPFRWFIGQPFNPRFLKGVIPHDFLWVNNIGERDDADLLMLVLLAKNEVKPWRRNSMFWGVQSPIGTRKWNDLEAKRRAER